MQKKALYKTFTTLPMPQLIDWSYLFVKAFTGNIPLKALLVSATRIKVTVNALVVLQDKALLMPSKSNFVKKDQQRIVLENQLRLIFDDINDIAKGDLLILDSVPVKITKTRETRVIDSKVTQLVVGHSKYAGQLAATWDPKKNVKGYLLQGWQEDGEHRVEVFCSKASGILAKLESGKRYTVRVTAIAAKTDPRDYLWSNKHSHIVQ